MIKSDYKETKIGTLPADWDLVKLEDIGITYGGLTNMTKEDFGEGKPYIPFLNILNNAKIDLSYFDYVDVQDGRKQNLVKKGDLFFNTSSETPEEVGMCSVLCDDVPELYLNSFCFGFRITNQKSLLPLFVSYFFRSDFGRKIIFPLAQGMTRYNLSKRYFLQISIPKPRVEEQQKIIDILSTGNDAIEKSDAIIEETKQLKKGLMQKLFSEGIGHTRFKETKIGRIPEEWELKRFIEMIVLQRGYDLPVQNRADGPYPVVASNGIIAYHREYKEKGPGVITGRSGTLGKVHYTESNYWPHNTALFSKEMYNNHSKFLYYYLQALKLDRYGTGTGVPTLNRNVVHKVRVAVPHLEEQSKIAQILSEVDAKIEREQATKKQWERLKKGLMQVLLTGKVRVKV